MHHRFIFALASTLVLAACNDEDTRKTDDASLHPAPQSSSSGGGGNEEPEVDNVAACEELADELECDNGVDISSTLPCTSYGSYACDLVDYFDCIADAWSCDPAQIDTAGLMSCASMLAC